MKVKIGVIFQALQVAEGQNKSGLQAQLRGEPFFDYGKLLALWTILEAALTECNLEIELPAGTDDLLVPFLRTLSPVS